MSIWSRVNDMFALELASASDDVGIEAILDTLSPEELRLWIAEDDLADELRPKHGLSPDFDDIVEREIEARDIERRAVA